MFKKRCLALLLISVMLATNVVLFTKPAEAADNVTVVIDNEFLQFDPAAPPQIINSRVMLPLRAFCDAFDTDEPKWDDATDKITITSGDSYAVFVIGSTDMQYGKFVTDANGGRSVDTSTVKVEKIDPAPVIVNGYSMIPIRAAEVAFGAEIEWVDATKTVMVKTNNQPTQVANPTPAPAPSASKDSGPQNIAFEDTAYFKEVSGGYIQDLHNSNSKFAVVIYDGKDPECIETVPQIKKAAADAQVKLYGFDVSSTRYNHPEKLTWVWELTDKSTHPALILSYAGKEDEVITDFSDMDVIEDKFKNLATTNPDLPSDATPVPTATPESTATPTPTPTSTPTSGYSWQEITIEKSEDMVKDGEKFAYVIYDSEQPGDYEDVVEIMQDLGATNNIPVYYTDIKGKDVGESYWAYKLGVYTIPSPSVMFIFSEDSIDTFTNVTTEDESKLEYEMQSLKIKLS